MHLRLKVGNVRNTNINWTNPSVLALSPDGDPVAMIEKLARRVVLQAMDQGWSGPPFNPVRLAHCLKLTVEADAAVKDAQTVPSENGLKIKYNPTQARERLRFSIAHEVAHTLFPDCDEAVRNRGGDRNVHDDWQLELLCNIAAAEFIMPMGSLPHAEQLPSIEEMLALRREFDVSAEAYLIRAAKTTREPIMMFVASAREKSGEVSYTVDYTVPSSSWAGQDIRGLKFDADSVVGRCRSIGHTERGDEKIADNQTINIEAVGVAAYPGQRLPRVAGLLRIAAPKRETRYNVVHGDVLQRESDGKRIVCQLVNDQARVWGGGVARASGARWPEAQKAFSAWIEHLPRPERLGQIHVWENGEVCLVSLVAQHGLKSDKGPPIRYFALEACLEKVADLAEANDLPVHMPRVGTGAAGGSWQVIEDILLATLVARNVQLTVVDPPPPRGQISLFD
jgi:O-acetyl-ADP-ribose deacetylase (regulator of RNase III)